MARTTAADVEKIIVTESSTDVDAFIDSASLLVDEVLEGEGMSDALLEEIEKWLAAHLIAMAMTRQLMAEKLGDASYNYGGTFGEGLKFTQYGQHAMILDLSGKLKKLTTANVKVYFAAL